MDYTYPDLAKMIDHSLLNPTLKRIFERVRPVHKHGLVSEAGWSFPSGHTSGATVAYGMLALVAIRTLPPRWHLPAVLGATALAYTVGSSRVFLQVDQAPLSRRQGFCTSRPPGGAPGGLEKLHSDECTSKT